VIESAVETCWNPVPETLKFCVIPNTLEVAELWVSGELAAFARRHDGLEVVGRPRDLPFNPAGNLVQEELFPRCIRAKRRA
jgi:hypothetical protein